MPRNIPSNLLPQITCPHCWQPFEPGQVLWVSVHADLRGDRRLGPDHQSRFMAARFSVRGHGYDERGQECRELACPHCHLAVPRAFLETRPWFVSILGTPACGKSYYLAAMSWALRRLLPQQFQVSFSDTEAKSNLILSDYEQQLFQNSNPDDLVSLGSLIRKTEEQGDLYDTVLDGERVVTYPRPFLFTLRPQSGHRQLDKIGALARILCLYDNAGESFLAGKDSPGNPVTRHLAQSSLLLFLFDPTQHGPFRDKLQRSGPPAARELNTRTSRQDLVLIEAAERVRRFANLGYRQKHDRPLFVVVTKRDLWEGLLGGDPVGPELVKTRDGRPALRSDRVEALSDRIRTLLRERAPEIVSAAEDFAEKVVYFGASALGATPERLPAGGWGVRPRLLNPQAVATPMLYGLHLRLPGLIAVARKADEGGGAEP